jgi:hypothetical protein
MSFLFSGYHPIDIIVYNSSYSLKFEQGQGALDNSVMTF